MIDDPDEIVVEVQPDPDVIVVEVAADIDLIVVEIPGEQGPQGNNGGDESRGQFVQSAPLAVWTIEHGLNRFPSLVLIDTAGDEFDGDARYVDPNTIVITFNAPQAGTAYLN